MNILSNNNYKSDHEMLQEAVDETASASGGTLMIPRINPRTGEAKYILDETVLLPSDIEIVLDNCLITVAEGALCNIFRNKNMYGEGWLTKEKEQKNIVIRGEGHAVLDGTGHNDVFEWSEEYVDGKLNILSNNFILFHNVDGFKVQNIEVRNQRWWAMNFIYCSNGYIADITSRAFAEFSNQDGINLRSGCHDIIIERISGHSGDDLIALTAMGGFTNKMPVEGKSIDICNVTVRDIIGTSAHEGIVTLRCHDDRKVYNILLENIIESNFENENNLPYGTLMLGQNYFFSEHIGEYGDMHDITVRNVYNKTGGTCITLGTTLVDSTLENIRAEKAVNVITTVNYDHEGSVKIVERGYGEDGIKIKNVKIKGVFADDTLLGTPVDLSVMRDEDFIEELEISDLHYGGNNEPIKFRKNGKSKIVFEGEVLT